MTVTMIRDANGANYNFDDERSVIQMDERND